VARLNSDRASVAAHKIWAFVAVTMLALSSNARAVDLHQSCADKRCAGNSNLVGECFTFHGKLQLSNGNPTYRIWRVGTKRILGVLCDEEPIVPANLKSALINASNSSWDRDFSGDYEVCPFTEEKPGWMQFVCVEKVTNLVVYDRRLKRIVEDDR
jgi:hypothetical protein